MPLSREPKQPLYQRGVRLFLWFKLWTPWHHFGATIETLVSFIHTLGPPCCFYGTIIGTIKHGRSYRDVTCWCLRSRFEATRWTFLLSPSWLQDTGSNEEKQQWNCLLIGQYLVTDKSLDSAWAENATANLPFWDITKILLFIIIVYDPKQVTKLKFYPKTPTVFLQQQLCHLVAFRENARF